jgi:DNA-binding CsgD family transcriptional regulator
MRTPEQRVESLAVSGAGLETSIGAGSTPQWRRHLDETLVHRFHAPPAQVRAAGEEWSGSVGTRDSLPLPQGGEVPARRPRDRYVPAWASPPSRSAGLSPREWDVLALIITGRSNRVIAARLGIRPNTVRKHVTTILDKLGARSRSQAIAVALDLEERGAIGKPGEGSDPA